MMFIARYFAASAISVAIVLPILYLLGFALKYPITSWLSIIDQSTFDALLNTLFLCTGVSILVTIIGVGTAWLVVAYDFKSKKILTWALLLPMAVPTYIVAYSYLDLLHPLGPLQEFLRTLLGYTSPKQWKIGDIRGLTTTTVLLSFVLYPYVYLSARAMFLSQSFNLLRAARSLGRSEMGAFFYVALPMARPAIALGVGLALLETVNDIGASEFLGVRTLTVLIYASWNNSGSMGGGLKIAIVLLFLILVMAYLSRDKKRKASYGNTRTDQKIEARPLKPWSSASAFVLGWLPVTIGFILPATHLCFQLIKRIKSQTSIDTVFVESIINSISIAAIATLLCITFSLLIVWTSRELVTKYSSFKFLDINVMLSKTGYAIPGTLLAIGLLTPYAWIDKQINHLVGMFSTADPRLFLLGSIAGISIACAIRFNAIAIGNISAGFSRIPIQLDQAARGLGSTPTGLLWRIYMPLLRPAIIASSLLIFVECMKELPVTLMLKPLNTETLATLLYADAARGHYEDSALSALMIVIIGLVPVVLLTRIKITDKRSV